MILAQNIGEILVLCLLLPMGILMFFGVGIALVIMGDRKNDRANRRTGLIFLGLGLAGVVLWLIINALPMSVW